MKRLPHTLIVSILGTLLFCSKFGRAFEADDDEADGDSSPKKSVVILEHSLGVDSAFKARCKLTYAAPRQTGVKAKRTVSLNIDKTTFSASDLQSLQELADAGKHYRVRLPSDVNNPDSPKVSASIPACMLIASDFHEIFRIHVDQFGHIRSLWYQTMALQCPSERVVAPTEPVQVVTSVAVDMESRGPRLAVEPVPIAEKGRDAEGKQKEEEKSFFQKNWYFIAGLMLLIFVINGDDPKGGEGGGGAGGGGGRK